MRRPAHMAVCADPIETLLAPSLTARDIDRLVAICADVPGRGDAKHYGLFRNIIRTKRLGSVLFVGVEGGRQIAFLLDLAARYGRVLSVSVLTDRPDDIESLADQVAPYLGNASIRLAPRPDRLALRHGEPAYELVLLGAAPDEAAVAQAMRPLVAEDGLLIGEDLGDPTDRRSDRALYAGRLWITDGHGLSRAA